MRMGKENKYRLEIVNIYRVYTDGIGSTLLALEVRVRVRLELFGGSISTVKIVYCIDIFSTRNMGRQTSRD